MYRCGSIADNVGDISAGAEESSPTKKRRCRKWKQKDGQTVPVC